MLTKRLLVLGALILTGTWSTYKGQERSVDTPQENALAKNAGIIKLDLAPINGKTKVDEEPALMLQRRGVAYTCDQKVRIQLIMTNNSAEIVHVPVLDSYYQNRPQLLKNGALVPYRQDIEKLLPLKDAEPEFVSVSSVTLKPSQSTKVEVLDLSDWYAPLEPGTYQLTDKHRFGEGGEWIESPAITFEVQSKSKPTS
jgi:hypothetical protein